MVGPSKPLSPAIAFTFAIVQEYMTKDESEGFIECHRKYIDVQYVASGIEQAGISAKSACCEAAKYDKDKDFQKLRGKTDFITLDPSVFAIFFTEDGHIPCMALSSFWNRTKLNHDILS